MAESSSHTIEREGKGQSRAATSIARDATEVRCCMRRMEIPASTVARLNYRKNNRTTCSRKLSVRVCASRIAGSRKWLLYLAEVRGGCSVCVWGRKKNSRVESIRRSSDKGRVRPEFTRFETERPFCWCFFHLLQPFRGVDWSHSYLQPSCLILLINYR